MRMPFTFSVDIANDTPSLHSISKQLKKPFFRLNKVNRGRGNNFEIENTTLHRFPKFGYLIRTVWRTFFYLVTDSSVFSMQVVLSLNGWSVLFLEFWSLG